MSILNSNRAVGTLLGVLLTAASVHAAPDAASPGATATPATLDQITDLARQLKIELQRKELREAKASGSGAQTPTAVVGTMPPGLSVTPPKSALAAQKLTPMPKPIASPPMVAGIVGSSGGPLKVRLINGRLASTGDSVPGLNGADSWLVKAVSSATVTFEQCQVVTAPPDKKKNAKPTSVTECITRVMAPASFQ